MPPTDSSGAAPGKEEQKRVTSWPRPATREKISWRWTSAPPAWGFLMSCQLKIRMRIGGETGDKTPGERSARRAHRSPGDLTDVSSYEIVPYCLALSFV